MDATSWMSLCWVETYRRYNGVCFCAGSYRECERMHSSFESSAAGSRMNMGTLYKHGDRRDLRRKQEKSLWRCTRDDAQGHIQRVTNEKMPAILLHPFPSQKNSNITPDDTSKNLQLHLVEAHQTIPSAPQFKLTKQFQVHHSSSSPNNSKCTTVQAHQTIPSAPQFKLTKQFQVHHSSSSPNNSKCTTVQAHQTIPSAPQFRFAKKTSKCTADGTRQKPLSAPQMRLAKNL